MLKIKKILTFLVISIFFLSHFTQPASAEKNKFSLEIQGNQANKKTLSIWLKDRDGQFLAYQETVKNSSSFKDLSPNKYLLEIWDKDILKNSDLYQNPAPLYRLEINIASSSLKIKPSWKTPLYKLFKNKTVTNTTCGSKKYTACPAGLVFSCEKNQGYCLKIGQKTTIKTKELAKQVHAILNYYRRQKKLPEFTWNDILAQTAEEHSRNMSANNFFDFNYPKGCDIVCRFNKQPKIQSLFAENISLRHWAASTYQNGLISKYNTQFSLAESIALFWSSDPKGQKTIFGQRYQNQGIGVFMDKNGEIYTTQEMSNFLSAAENQNLKTKITSLFKETDSQLEKITRIYEWLTGYVKYDVFTAGGFGENWPSYSLVGAYRNQLAVCQGYAELLRLALSYAGINSQIVTGQAESNGKLDNHAWNKVTIDGQEYFLDPTWDSGYLDDNGKFQAKQSKSYFLKPAACFRLNHTNEQEKVLTKEEKIKYADKFKYLFDGVCSEIKEEVLRK